MRYRIFGQDESTRRPIELTIDAPDEPAARGDAKARGVIISRIEPEGRAPREHVQLIELTAKRWKFLFAVSAVVFTLSLILAIYFLMRTPRTLAHPPLSAILFSALAAVGLLGLFAARLAAWWHHG
jgi:hypothetical protein